MAQFYIDTLMYIDMLMAWSLKFSYPWSLADTYFAAPGPRLFLSRKRVLGYSNGQPPRITDAIPATMI